MKVALHVRFSWLKNKHKKHWTASSSVTLTLSWLSYNTVSHTLSSRCLFFFFPPQDCNCREVLLPYALTTLGTLLMGVPGWVLSHDWTWRLGKLRGHWLERIPGPPDTQGEHRPLVPGPPDTRKHRPRPAVTHSVCNPGLSTPRLSLSLVLISLLLWNVWVFFCTLPMCQRYEEEKEGFSFSALLPGPVLS